MNKKILCYTLLLTPLLTTHAINFFKDERAFEEVDRAYAKHRPTDFRLNNEIIVKIDGKKGFFDARSYQDTLRAIKAIFEIQYGTLNKETGQRIGLFTFQGNLVAVQQLVIKEHELTLAKTPQSDPVWQELKVTLQAAKDEFTEKMKVVRGRSEDNPIAKSIKHKLIAFYLHDQNIPNSLMKNADLPHEKAELNAASALEFFRFLNDLKHFLEDLSDSCTEARKQYQEYIQKTK